MNLISWLWKPLYLPRWLFRYWRNRIYLHSVGWKHTREVILRQQWHECQHCHSGFHLDVHHTSYANHPKPRLWHFLPFARFFIWELDYSPLLVLCRACHAKVHGK